MKFRPFEGGGGGGGFVVSTAIDITEMPASVKVGVKFLVKGKLYRKDTKAGIQAAKVDVYPALEPLTSATTDSLGIFLAYVTIKEVGDLAVVVRFGGTDYSAVAEWFGSASTMKSITVTNGVVPPPPDEVPPPPDEVPPPPGEGNARIVEINLPDELGVGKVISGTVKVTNNGDEDEIRLRVVEKWTGKKYYVVKQKLSHGSSIKVSITDVFMPNENATFHFLAGHLENGSLVFDHTAVHIVTLKGVAPPTEYVCPVCGAKFASKADLDKHIALAHPPPPPVRKKWWEEVLQWTGENPLYIILLILGIVGGIAVVRRR